MIYAQIFSAANAIAASLKVQELSAGKPKLYWAHSFTLVLITGTEHTISISYSSNT